MNRTIRMLLIVGVFGAVGMVVLSMMLSRYNRMSQEVRSLDQLESEQPETIVESLLDSGEEADAPATEAPPRTQAEIEVEQFIEIRREIKTLVGQAERNPARWVDTTTGTFAPHLEQYAMEELRGLMTQVRLQRLAGCQRVGLDEVSYLRLRDAFRDWRAGNPLDEELAAAFAAQDEQVEEFDLGMMEALDG